jgi:TolB protein
MVTATATPIFVLLDGELPPMTATPAPSVASETIPAELIGKIAFKSDRTGKEEIYVINPDGSGLALLSDRWPYDLAREADAYSSDGRFRVFVKDAIIDTGIEQNGEVIPVQLRIPALYFYDYLYQAEEQVTHFGSGIAYDPAWSPISEQIVFVSDDSGNDEIWVINRDGSGAVQLTRNNWEWDKHPSWSPDGTKIAFWSNRTGIFQIWVMDADGNSPYSLSRTGFNDWDPVWFKYTNVPE